MLPITKITIDRKICKLKKFEHNVLERKFLDAEFGVLRIECDNGQTPLLQDKTSEMQERHKTADLLKWVSHILWKKCEDGAGCVLERTFQKKFDAKLQVIFKMSYLP